MKRRRSCERPKDGPPAHAQLFYPNLIQALEIWKFTNPKSWLAQHAVGYVCGNSASDNIANWATEGAIKEGVLGAVAGAIAGGPAGAVAGASAGAENGAATGTAAGAAASKVCNDTGVYAK